MIDLQQQLASNLETVQERIKAAALRSGRLAQDVFPTKYVGHFFSARFHQVPDPQSVRNRFLRGARDLWLFFKLLFVT